MPIGAFYIPPTPPQSLLVSPGHFECSLVPASPLWSPGPSKCPPGPLKCSPGPYKCLPGPLKCSPGPLKCPPGPYHALLWILYAPRDHPRVWHTDQLCLNFNQSNTGSIKQTVNQANKQTDSQTFVENINHTGAHPVKTQMI